MSPLKRKKRKIDTEYILLCERCGLSDNRRKVVIGRGNFETAKVLFLGSSPELSDDCTGSAFSGAVGRVLRYLISDVGIPKDTWAATNCVLCRACDKRSGPDRLPQPYEILACSLNIELLTKHFLPKRVVLLGDIPMQYYAHRFPGALRLQDPEYLSRTGGPSSPAYSYNYRKLLERWNEIKGSILCR